MDNKILGSVFIISSSILYSSIYISAAIYGSTSASKSQELFSTYLGYLGVGLIIPAIILFIIGIILIISSRKK